MVGRTPREKIATIVAFCRTDAGLDFDRVRDYLRFTLSDNNSNSDLLALLNDALGVEEPPATDMDALARDYLNTVLADKDPTLLAALNAALTAPVKRPRGRPPKKRVTPTQTAPSIKETTT